MKKKEKNKNEIQADIKKVKAVGIKGRERKPHVHIIAVTEMEQ